MTTRRTTGGARPARPAKRAEDEAAIDGPDTNGRVAGLLSDMASLQTSTHSREAYKRAAATILNLEEPLEALVERDGGLRKIPTIGESSARVALEVLRLGRSPTVEREVAASARVAEVAASRAVRDHFFSRVQVAAALRNRRLRGVAAADYLGDLQMHSTWSDGRESIAALADGCLARGYRYCAVTDHSHGLVIGRGMTFEQATRQHAEIDAVNRRHAGRFRVIKGIEANIMNDGRLDMPAAELRRMELVLAAPHSNLRIPGDQTERLVRVIVTPGVHVLAHPRGRQFGSRAGIVADWDLVFAAAARYGVAIEIDGDPSRQDVDVALARRAMRAGCLFALDSDAHSTSELSYADTAIAHARLAGIPKARVINCWDVERLLRWASKAWRRDVP